MAKAKKTAGKPASPGNGRGRLGNPWEQFPDMSHLSGIQRENMERRRRQRLVRYWCFRLQTLVQTKREPVGPEAMPGFLEFWLEQRPAYQVDPRGRKVAVDPIRNRTVGELGGYDRFAILWDVDTDLNVYLRHSSIWHEWQLTLMRVVPVLGDH